MGRRKVKRRPALPAALSLGIVAGTIAVVVIAERRSPLRHRRETYARHALRDIAIAATSAVATRRAQSAFIDPLLRRLQSERLGILGLLRLPAPVRVTAGVLLLDYTLWLWHRLNHEVPALWRFHRVHHVDLDLDAATGARFHFGEMTFAAFFRWLQLRTIGPDPLAVSLWQTMLLSSIFFHHSNTRLPEGVDRTISQLVVTPRMHGIHHSIVESETNSNFGSLFTLWDMLHGVFRIDVPQETITIGVPAYQQPEQVTLPRVLALPLRPARGDWSV